MKRDARPQADFHREAVRGDRPALAKRGSDRPFSADSRKTFAREDSESIAADQRSALPAADLTDADAQRDGRHPSTLAAR